MALPRPSPPKAVWRDLRQFMAGEHRHKLLFGTLALLMPAIIIFGFVKDGQTNIMPGRTIVYANSWPVDRSDAEIKAQQKIDEAKREKARQERQAAYQRLANKLGIE